MKLQTYQKHKGKKMKKSLLSLCLFFCITISIPMPQGVPGNQTDVMGVSIDQNNNESTSMDIPHSSQSNSVAYTSTSTTKLKVPSTFKEPVIAAQFAILMDSQTGQVLYKKNENSKAFPASITKILTGLLTVENLKEDDIITMSHDAIYSVERDSSHIALQVDEQITMEEALNALLLVSANDAANGLAERVGGSLQNFAAMMTARAKEIGATGTQFTNANGLPDDNHYTTAYDMALITREALKNDTFRRYFTKIEYTLQPTNLQPESRYFLTHHKMLYNTRYQYKSAIAGKTGYTSKAGSTLVTIANKDGHELICVSLKETAGEAYADAKTLLDYGFSQFEPVVLTATAYSNSSIKLTENNKDVGTGQFLNLSDNTIWVPKGTGGMDPSMIQIKTGDVVSKHTNINKENFVNTSSNPNKSTNASNNTNAGNNTNTSINTNANANTNTNDSKTASSKQSETVNANQIGSIDTLSKSNSAASNDDENESFDWTITSTDKTGGFDILINTNKTAQTNSDGATLDVSNNLNIKEILLNAKIPELMTSFYEASIIIPLQTQITLNPQTQKSPLATDQKDTGKTILTVLKYSVLAVLGLIVAYLIYVLIMIFYTGYHRKLWKKTRKKINKIKKNRTKNKIRNGNTIILPQGKPANKNIQIVRKIKKPEDLDN